jgi:hypothetical protein
MHPSRSHEGALYCSARKDGMKLRSRLACWTVLLVAPALSAGARVTFSLDYSLDAGGLFDSSAARTAMERATQVFSDRFVDHLTDITSGGANTWSARIVNPGTGAANYDPGLTSVAANVIKIYVGSRSLNFPDVGNTVAGTAVVSGTQSFLDNAASRGQAGALSSPKSDFGPWGGSIAFDIGTPWYFGLTSGGLTSNKLDFLSVATHELAHLLGFSASQPSWSRLVSNGTFTGAKAIAANGNIAPKVTGSHWLGMSSTVGPTGPAQTALMDAALPTGTRRQTTVLDWAALSDSGWQLAIPGDTNANGIIDFGDFQILEQNLGRTNARWSQGDFNEDGIVNTADYALLLKNYSRQQAGSTEPPFDSTVPEAGLSTLAVLGIASILARPRRRNIGPGAK